MDLKLWIEGNKKDYNLGVAIFEAHGGSPTLLRMLKKSPSKFNQEKLREKLQEIYEAKQPVKSAFNDKLAHMRKQRGMAEQSAVNAPAAAKELPAELIPIYDLKLGAFKKMSAMHQQLASIKGNGPKAIESRYKLQKEIVLLDELNEQCWDKIHYFEEHGKLPVDESGFYPDQLTIRELVQLEKAIPTYITKLAKDANNLDLPPEHRQKLFDRKAEWHLKQQRIKQELDALPVLSKVKEALC